MILIKYGIFHSLKINNLYLKKFVTLIIGYVAVITIILVKTYNVTRKQ